MYRSNGFSLVVKMPLEMPPTNEVRLRAAKVLQKRRPVDDAQFIDEIRMLGLEDLISI